MAPALNPGACGFWAKGGDRKESSPVCGLLDTKLLTEVLRPWVGWRAEHQPGHFNWCQRWLQKLLGAKVRAAATSSPVLGAPASIQRPLKSEVMLRKETQVSGSSQELTNLGQFAERLL